MSDVYEARSAELVSYGTPVYDDAPKTYDEAVEAQPQHEEGAVTPETPEVAEVTPTAEIVTSEEAPKQEEVEHSEQEKIFREMFEKTFGIPPEELRNELESTRQEKQRLEAERQLTQLQTEWGVDEVTMSERLALINKRLTTLPEAARQALDNYDGINLIWNAIRAEQPQQDALPRYEKNSVAGGANTQRPMFTKEQLASMSADEYRKNNDAILYAYQHNLIA